MSRKRLSASGAALVTAALGVLGTTPVPAQETSTGEIVDRTTLRVCADPNNLPYSNQAGEGFENKIAELLAADLGVGIEYTWYPGAIGFVRNTLGAHRCDVVMGVATTNELMQNSNPYYHSGYVLVQRADAEVKATSLHDPALEQLTIGAIARTPPFTILARQGLLDNVRSYQLMVDTRHYHPAQDVVTDVAAGEIDIGVLWGPIAGYWARRRDGLEVTPLTSDAEGIRLDFRISLGLRRGEPEWKETLNTFLDTRADDIQAILVDYGVPLLDAQGRLIPAAKEAIEGAKQGAVEGVPEAAGERRAEHRGAGAGMAAVLTDGGG